MKMNCDDFTPFIDAYIDGEFDERDRVEFEAHLAHCEACKQEVDFQLQFKQHLKVSLQEDRAPQALRHNILAALEQEAAQIQQEEQEAARAESRRRRKIWAAPLAASMAILLFLPAFTIAPASSKQLPVIEQTVDWHQGNLPLEVQGTQDQVARWFHGKVDFPVRLPHFKHDSARLLGARIANVQDRRAAYLLYDIDGARMSVMVFRGDGLKVPSDKVRNISGRDVALMNANGYEVAVMQDNGVTYTMTTELDKNKFVTLMEEALKH